MFKVAPNVTDRIEVIEIQCPVCGNDSVEPISNERSQWECCLCGMEFEVNYEEAEDVGH